MPWSVHTFGFPRFANANAAKSSGRWAWMIEARGVGRPGADTKRRRRKRTLLGPLRTRTYATPGRRASPFRATRETETPRVGRRSASPKTYDRVPPAPGPLGAIPPPTRLVGGGEPARLDVPLGGLVHDLRSPAHRLNLRTALRRETDLCGEVCGVPRLVEQGRALERAAHRGEVREDEGLVGDHELEHLVREGDLRDRGSHVRDDPHVRQVELREDTLPGEGAGKGDGIPEAEPIRNPQGEA